MRRLLVVLFILLISCSIKYGTRQIAYQQSVVTKLSVECNKGVEEACTEKEKELTKLQKMIDNRYE